MAIQLNDRDYLIFKLIEEHKVLLEKHISWFISSEDKPVLIRDRLRKLFYLDYLLCHRHGTKLPWWTTPTKPLVYLLSPTTRTMSSLDPEKIDLFDSGVQRHFLEVANLRMLHLVGQKDGQISEFSWTTCDTTQQLKKHLDAKVSFVNGGKSHRIGIVNHPDADQKLVDNLVTDMQSEDIEMVMIVSRDELHQKELQQLIAASAVSGNCFFATHHELYRTGMTQASWQNTDGKQVALFATPMPAKQDPESWGPGFNSATSSAIA